MKRHLWITKSEIEGIDVETGKPIKIIMIDKSCHWIPQPKGID